jgi:hypothetical protein
MKKLIFVILLILLFPAWAGAAEYYYDSVNGADGNDGLTGNPWKTLPYAASKLIAGDTLSLSTSKTEPGREGIYLLANGEAENYITISGQSISTPAYLTGTINVSQGASPRNMIQSGDCEKWNSDSELWGNGYINSISITGNPIAKATNPARDIYSINATKTDANIYYSFEFYLAPSTEYTILYYHYEIEANYRTKYIILERAPTPDNYLQADGTWSSSSYTFDPLDNSNGAWAKTSKTFITNGAGLYRITLQQTYITTIYWDDITLMPTSSGVPITYSWENVTDKNYKKLNIPISREPKTLLWSANSSWSVNGVESLTYATKASDIDNCNTTVNSFFWDSTTNILYFYPSQDITGLHIELGQPIISTGLDYDSTVNVNAAYISLNNLTVYGSNGSSFKQAPTNGTNGNHTNLSSYYSASTALNVLAGGSAIVDGYRCDYTYSEDCASAYGAPATLVLSHADMTNSEDDGAQASDGGSITISNSLVHNIGHQMAGDNSGIANEGINSSINVRNVIVYGAYGRGISHLATGIGSATVINSIAYGTVNGADAHTGEGVSTFTHTNNIFGDKSAAWTLGDNEVLSDPLLNPTTYIPAENSPAINAGDPTTCVTLVDSTDYDGLITCKDSLPVGNWRPSPYTGASGVDIGPYGVHEDNRDISVIIQ